MRGLQCWISGDRNWVDTRFRCFSDFNISFPCLNVYQSSRKRNAAVRNLLNCSLFDRETTRNRVFGIVNSIFRLRHFLFYFKVKLQPNPSIQEIG